MAMASFETPVKRGRSLHAYSRLVEHPQCVRTCRQRQVRLALEVDREHEQHFGEENRQVRAAPGLASRDGRHSAQALEPGEHVDRNDREVRRKLHVALVDERLERTAEPLYLVLAEALAPSLLDLFRPTDAASSEPSGPWR